MRTQAQIIAECEAAYEKLKQEVSRRDQNAKAEAEKPFNARPCRTCAYGKVGTWVRCRHPLIKGLRADAGYVDTLSEIKRNAPLCGEEKALWEQRRIWPIRIWQSFWPTLQWGLTAFIFAFIIWIFA